LKDQGKFVKDNDRIAIAVAFKNARITDDYGNQCDIDAILLRYISNESQLINIKRVSVHYQLKDTSSCQ